MHNSGFLKILYFNRFMNRAEIRELLKKREAGKIDNYLKFGGKKKQNHSDLLNLLQTWVHCLLYYKRIYPHYAFQQRQVLGIPVFVASSPPLKQYLDDFFDKIKPHLLHINHIQVLIYDQAKQLVEISTIHVEDLANTILQQDFGNSAGKDNTLLKEMEIKSFLYDLKSHFGQSQTMEAERELSFKLRLGYRQQSNQKESRNLLEGWILRQKINQNGKIACSLKSTHLNLIYEVIN